MEFDLLKEIIAEVLNVDTAEIKPETTFVDDLGADSLDVFQIIMGVEEKLNIEVDTELVVDGIIDVFQVVEQIRFQPYLIR